MPVLVFAGAFFSRSATELLISLRLKIERLTRDAFAPFGNVITLTGAQHYPINDGTTERFHDLALIDVSDQDGRPLLSLFRSKPRPLPFEIRIMERHPSGARRSYRFPKTRTLP